MKKIKILICFAAAAVLLMLSCTAAHAEKYYVSASTEEDFYAAVAVMTTDFQEEGGVKAPFCLNDISFSRIPYDAVKKDPYAGGNLHTMFCSEPEYSNGYYYYDLSFTYYMTASQVKKVDGRVASIASELTGSSDYEKVKAAHDYLILNCEYSTLKDGAYNALFKGRANCNGYALAFQRIMDELGIPCLYLTGDDHAWNAVCLDGQWYNMDVTWDDMGGREVGYDYFLRCNQHWDEHPYGSSDADKNYPLLGMRVYHKFPPYNLIGISLKLLIVIAAAVVGFYIYRRTHYSRTVYLTFRK